MGRLARVLPLSLLAGIAGMLVAVTETGFVLDEEHGLSWLFALRGARPPPADAAIVRLDRDTLLSFRSLSNVVDEWPPILGNCARRRGGLDALTSARTLSDLPRPLYACLIDELDRLGAASVVLDVAFPSMPRRDDDIGVLADSILANGRVVLLERAVRTWLRPGPNAKAGMASFADVLEAVQPALLTAAAAVAPLTLPRASAKIAQFWTFNQALADPVQLPVRALEVSSLDAIERLANAVGEGQAGFLQTGTTPSAKRQALVTWFLSTGRDALDHPVAAGLAPLDLKRLRALGRVYDGPRQYYLNFYGPPGTLTSISLFALLAGAGPMPDLRGRTIFVGYQELDVPTVTDSFPTVFKGRPGIDMGGIEVATTAYGNLLDVDMLRSLPEGLRVALVGIVSGLFVFASCLGTVWRGLALTLAAGAIYAMSVVAAFTLGHIWLPLVVPIAIMLPAAVLIGQLAHYIGAVRWFEIYVPRQVTRHLLQGDESMSIRRHGEVTVMFTDLAGFSHLAQEMPAATVAEFINTHFTMVTRLVEAEDGTVNQFIGDSVMAFWGAPDPLWDHGARACRTALAIKNATEKDNLARMMSGRQPLRIRIGINTGPISAGNIGAPGRSTYTILGDTVNATQRIEQLGKSLTEEANSVTILVGAATARQAGEAFLFEDVGRHALRGREGVDQIFRLRGLRSDRRDAPVLADLPASSVEG